MSCKVFASINTLPLPLHVLFSSQQNGSKLRVELVDERLVLLAIDVQPVVHRFGHVEVYEFAVAPLVLAHTRQLDLDVAKVCCCNMPLH